MAGSAAAIVTNPVAKNVLYRSGFAEPGHTEFLAKLAAEATGKPVQPVMMLWSPELAVVPVTIHLPLREIFKQLSVELVVDTGRIVARDLPRGSASPTRASPSPGSIRMPARTARSARKTAPSWRRRSRASSPKASTPAGRCRPTRCSTRAARATYDVALCMYHDQALIPIKTLAFDHAVNVTLGLPFVRTSPDHGTAFDIAGTGRADPSSLVAALRLAARLAYRAPLRSPRRDRRDGLPPLRDVIRRHGLAAKKSLGQNFLLDLNLTARIARAAGPRRRHRDRGRAGARRPHPRAAWRSAPPAWSRSSATIAPSPPWTRSPRTIPAASTSWPAMR